MLEKCAERTQRAPTERIAFQLCRALAGYRVGHVCRGYSVRTDMWIETFSGSIGVSEPPLAKVSYHWFP